MADSQAEVKDLAKDVTPQNPPNETATATDNIEKAEEIPEATQDDRAARFKALKARAKGAADTNLKEAAAETKRMAQDPNMLTALSRKHAIASHKLLKADTTLAGEDFERKRAWDWTAEESEKWDKRMDKKARRRDNVAFQDYRAESNKVYKRQISQMKPDLESYEKQKQEAVDRAARTGNLEIVETNDGELVAVDKDGTFYSTAESTDFVSQKPDKAAVDRLVNDLQKAEETRLKKRRERAKDQDDGDVTYINDKNKQFNSKLARFYNKYTGEIRDSFERGTMI